MIDTKIFNVHDVKSMNGKFLKKNFGNSGKVFWLFYIKNIIELTEDGYLRFDGLKFSDDDISIQTNQFLNIQEDDDDNIRFRHWFEWVSQEEFDKQYHRVMDKFREMYPQTKNIPEKKALI